MPEAKVERDTQGDATGGAVSLDDEDSKLVTLARAARARVGAVEGAAVRDGDGRTYAGVTVRLPSVTITALQLSVASAVAAGASRLEAAAVVTEASTLDAAGRAAVRDVGVEAPIHVASPAGEVLATVTD